MNHFGDLFIQLDDEAIHMFDVGGGTLIQIADNREHFLNQVAEIEFANQMLMLPLVDQLVAHGKLIEDGYCYSYVKSPVLGGDYTVQNTKVIPISEHDGLNGTIHEQIRSLPDGSKVTIEIDDSIRSH